MALSNCPRCNKLFNKTAGVSYCHSCVEWEEECFKKVYEYLCDHKAATIPEINQDTGVDEKLIIKYLEEGRLAKTGTTLTPQCRRCGAKIEAGTLCKDCIAKSRDEISAAASQTKEQIAKIQTSQVTSEPKASRDKGDIAHQLRTDKYRG